MERQVEGRGADLSEDHKGEAKRENGILGFLKLDGLTKEKREKAVILFLMGLFFLLAATPVSRFSQKKEKTAKQTGKIMAKTEIQAGDAYLDELENKLKKTIEGMDGAGNVTVMITLKDKGEKILDKNHPYESDVEKDGAEQTERTNIRSDQQTVLVEQEGNTSPIIVQEMYPDIEGVLVVCSGGDDPALVLRIKEAVSALFSIDDHKVVVCRSKQP